MKKLVTISREHGSGGRIIGKILAEKLGVPFYDKEIIDMAVQESGFSREMIESAELKAKSSFAYNLASALNFSEGMSSSPLSVNEKLFLAQFQVIAEIGNKEEGSHSRTVRRLCAQRCSRGDQRIRSRRDRRQDKRDLSKSTETKKIR